MAMFFSLIISVSDAGGVICDVNSSTMNPSSRMVASRRERTSFSNFSRLDISESDVYWLAHVR